MSIDTPAYTTVPYATSFHVCSIRIKYNVLCLSAHIRPAHSWEQQHKLGYNKKKMYKALAYNVTLPIITFGLQ